VRRSVGHRPGVGLGLVYVDGDRRMIHRCQVCRRTTSSRGAVASRGGDTAGQIGAWRKSSSPFAHAPLRRSAGWTGAQKGGAERAPITSTVSVGGNAQRRRTPRDSRPAVSDSRLSRPPRTRRRLEHRRSTSPSSPSSPAFWSVCDATPSRRSVRARWRSFDELRLWPASTLQTTTALGRRLR
jgi:hypothetical protein